jgi:aspartate dehydrogenase
VDPLPYRHTNRGRHTLSTRLVVIGYGAIAAELIDRLCERKSASMDLAVLLKPDSKSANRIPAGVKLLTQIEDVIGFAPDLVIEAAGHQAIREYAEDCLKAGLSLVAVSVGVMADASLFSKLRSAAVEGSSRLIFPSGAIGSLDYVSAVRGLDDTQITYESRKPVSAWANELTAMGMNLQISLPIVLYEGNAREAAIRYPQNLNVAASLAIAGVGFERTNVRIVVDPAAKGNVHQIIATGSFGSLKTEIANIPSPANPKTSWVVGLSLLAAIDRYFSPIVFG